MTPWHQVPAPGSKLHSACWYPLGRVVLPAPARPPAVIAFPLAPWGSRMWQESTDLNTAPNSIANRLCVFGNFSEPQRILEYILVSQSAVLGPPVTETLCVRKRLGGFQSHCSRISGAGSQAPLVIWWLPLDWRVPKCPSNLVPPFSRNPLPWPWTGWGFYREKVALDLTEDLRSCFRQRLAKTWESKEEVSKQVVQVWYEKMSFVLISGTALSS